MYVPTAEDDSNDNTNDNTNDTNNSPPPPAPEGVMLPGSSRGGTLEGTVEHLTITPAAASDSLDQGIAQTEEEVNTPRLPSEVSVPPSAPASSTTTPGTTEEEASSPAPTAPVHMNTDSLDYGIPEAEPPRVFGTELSQDGWQRMEILRPWRQGQNVFSYDCLQ
jgi:hypothetical protein